MDFLNFIQKVPGYLEDADDDVVLFFTIKFYRNLEGFLFPLKMNGDDIRKVKEKVISALDLLPTWGKNLTIHEISTLPNHILQIYFERGIIGYESFQNKFSSVTFNSDERFVARICERDHLKFIARGTYKEFDDLTQEVEIYMGILDKKLDFAFKEGLGYLSASPRYLGHALNISVVLHVPAIFILGQIQSFTQILQKNMLILSGLMDTNIQTYGAFVQVKLTSFFDSTQEVRSKVRQSLEEIKELEAHMRNLILVERPIEIEDRIFKSLAILRNSRLLSLPEVYDHLSNVRLGVDLGYIKDLHPRFFKEAFFRILPSHIKVFYSVPEDDFLKESEMRALLIQELLDKYYAG
ncbi:MAG: hypothetical protein ABIL77_02400 [candidate division WOR-3 bacterium]